MATAPMRGIPATELNRAAAYRLLNSVIVPRAIAWVATVGPDGTPNIAPHSYTTIASVDPPMVLFVSVGHKDTARNVSASGQFTLSTVDHDLAERMNVTSASAPPDVNEFELAGLESEPSVAVAPPRVSGTPAALECELEQIIELGADPSVVVIGRVVHAHLREDLIGPDGTLDQSRVDAVARMGGNTYSRTTDRFDLTRPSYDELAAAGKETH